MCAHFPQPNPRDDIRAPEALDLLRRWIARFSPRTRDRGDDYFRDGRVKSVTGKSDSVHAIVEGNEEYAVVITLAGRGWQSECTCPMGFDCKHVVAAGFAWMAANGSDPRKPASGAAYDHNAAGVATAYPNHVDRPRKPSFREKWTPILAEKLGRPLTVEEGHLLGQLSALFAEFRQARNQLYPEAARRHGFASAVPASEQAWQPIFTDWWSNETIPIDPWDLWQYLACGMELNGCPIPEVFRPLTDTSKIRSLLETKIAQKHLAIWKHTLRGAVKEKPARSVSALRQGVAGLRVKLNDTGSFQLEVQTALNKPWKRPTRGWLDALNFAKPADLELFTPSEAAILTVLISTRDYRYSAPNLPSELDREVVSHLLAYPVAYGAMVLPDDSKFAVMPEPLVATAELSGGRLESLVVQLVAPDGAIATEACVIADDPEPFYLYRGRVWRGPPPLPDVPLPVAALGDPELATMLRKAGLRLPKSLEGRCRVVKLKPKLRIWLEESESSAEVICAQLLAHADDPKCEQHWTGHGGWSWTKDGAPPARHPDDPFSTFDLSAAEAVTVPFAQFRFGWASWDSVWTCLATRNFPEEFAAWRAALPDDLTIEASSELAGLLDPPLRAAVDFSALPTDASHDWFDLSVSLRVADTTLTEEEIALLLKARCKWVRLPRRGWQRLVLDDAAAGATSTVLDRLGVGAADVLVSGKPMVHRLHALQLASEASAFEAQDSQLAKALRNRAAQLSSLAAPTLPAGLNATLRPYQRDGFHFLAQLSANRFGGVLADDMGLGKTVQALAWLLHLVHSCRGGRAKFRVLVVCPKSVTHGWQSEAARFTPGLKTELFVPALTERKASLLKAQLLVANYTQLRLHADWFASSAWDAVILDEGQFIKNPGSQVAAAARGLKATHRLVLTGTPIENRLTDLWSIFAFALPGLLGPQTGFRRQYPEMEPAALARLHRRVSHFMLRRTKAQAAPDLPSRTEDELMIELEPGQRKLYDAELKRARRQLLGLENDRALDKVRFNILASLLRLRQICCHPVLVDSAHADLPSAKLDALIERVEELRDEGHQVLVFSQFVEMLDRIRERLIASEIGYLMLTGATQNRAALVETFQSDRTKTVFLLSLKAAGFGLNLTAASYAILFDPWWNPAVEAQAIDRTHRIGQSKPVFAYRLIARNTVEEKIRLLQREKSELAAAVVQEETLAKVLDLESLKRILA